MIIYIRWLKDSLSVDNAYNPMDRIIDRKGLKNRNYPGKVDES